MKKKSRILALGLISMIGLGMTACSQSKKTENGTEKTVETAQQIDTNTQEEDAPKYIEIVQKDLSGKEVKLSEVVKKNRYTLIDFWASWCGPCRMEIPYLVEAYAKYQSKGFEIYGVSLDEDKDAWKNAVQGMQMKWIQVSDLKGWHNEAAQAYGVQSIPANMLVDTEGKIVATNLRGEDVAHTLENLLK